MTDAVLAGLTDIDDQPLTRVMFFAEEDGRLLIVTESSDDVRVAAVSITEPVSCRCCPADA